VLAVVLTAGMALAQATPTPWVAATTPGISPKRARALVLLDAATVAGTSGGAEVGAWQKKAALVSVSDVCSSFEVTFEASSGGGDWGTVAVATSPGSVDLSSFTVKYLRAVLTAATDCSVSASLSLTPDARR